MKKYFKFLMEKIYLGILIILGCAMLGSVYGAYKESKESLPGVTGKDVLISQGRINDVPKLTGILPLAEEQNKWYNFKYAGKLGVVGFVLYCILMACYLPLYHFKFFEAIREWMGVKGKD